MIRLYDVFKNKVITVCESFLENQFLQFVSHCYNKLLTKPVSIGWWQPTNWFDNDIAIKSKYQKNFPVLCFK